jgi:hypothetical protein
MDSRIRGTLHKLYLTVFWSLVIAGIGGSGFATLIAFADGAGGTSGFCNKDYASDFVLMEDELLNENTSALLRNEECVHIFFISVFGAWLPFLTLVISKKVLYEKWFLWIVSDWKSSGDASQPGK